MKLGGLLLPILLAFFACGGDSSSELPVRAPEKSGDYLLHLTLVQEGVAWFSEKDGGHVLLSVSVK